MIDQGNNLVNGDIDPPESQIEIGDYVCDDRTGFIYKCIVEGDQIELVQDEPIYFHRHDNVFQRFFIK